MIEINTQWKEALALMEDGSKHILLTGKAGTGKSTLLRHFRNTTQKKLVVLAPTGVAAVNVSGQTIHSFFGFKPDINIHKIRAVADEKAAKYEKIETIVIDEISMVRADLLDCIDHFLRLNGPKKKAPFGGVQLIFIGDLYQLPPVVMGAEKVLFKGIYSSPYFFSAHVLTDQHIQLHYIELETVYRQKDLEFIQLLNNIRTNAVTAEDLATLNKQIDADFEPTKQDFYLTLTTTNALADQVNATELEKLKGRSYTFTAQIDGDVRAEQYPTIESLDIKVGAQVMMLTNDPSGRWVNGTMGCITKIITDPEEATQLLGIRLENNKDVLVEPHTWEIFEYNLNKQKQLDTEVVGSFTQYPLRLAFAITIHKSQGKTFEKVIIDIGKGVFAHGQMYVALSRCTSLEGIILRKAIAPKHVMIDYQVRKFVTESQYTQSKQKLSKEDKWQIIGKAIKQKKQIQMKYLKAKDEKSDRILTPHSLEPMQFAGKIFMGLSAYCHLRNEERVFNVDRILSLEIIETPTQPESD